MLLFFFFFFLVGTASCTPPCLITECTADEHKQPRSLTLCVAGGPELSDPLEGVFASSLPLYLYTRMAPELVKTIASKKKEKKKSLSLSDVMSEVTRTSNPFHPSVEAKNAALK